MMWLSVVQGASTRKRVCRASWTVKCIHKRAREEVKYMMVEKGSGQLGSCWDAPDSVLCHGTAISAGRAQHTGACTAKMSWAQQEAGLPSCVPETAPTPHR